MQDFGIPEIPFKRCLGLCFQINSRSSKSTSCVRTQTGRLEPSYCVAQSLFNVILQTYYAAASHLFHKSESQISKTLDSLDSLGIFKNNICDIQFIYHYQTPNNRLFLSIWPISMHHSHQGTVCRSIGYKAHGSHRLQAVDRYEYTSLDLDLGPCFTIYIVSSFRVVHILRHVY